MHLGWLKAALGAAACCVRDHACRHPVGLGRVRCVSCRRRHGQYRSMGRLGILMLSACVQEMASTACEINSNRWVHMQSSSEHCHNGLFEPDVIIL